MNNSDNDMIRKLGIKKRRNKVSVLLIVGALIFLTVPYIYNALRYSIFPGESLRARYSDFPYVATISITNFLNQKDYDTANEIIEARADWVHNQKNDWDKYKRRRYYTLDLSQSGKITIVFGYEKDFDIYTFTNEITKPADLSFVDSNNNKIFNNTDIVSASYAYQGATQSYDVSIKLTEAGMQQFLKIVGPMNEDDNNIRVIFKGSLPSDSFTIKAADKDSVVIKGFINSAAAESLVKLIELKDTPNDLKVELRAK